ncbi:MAG: XTP/dITP diphosphatase [Dissulfurimicrobium sp.]|uniref:XTP/dITP diphosphatase n=1 Tax=Dissulfurimicrobium sp. TaxID=2022436 RepID=UPI00404A485D
MKKQIILATRNKGKIDEIRSMLSNLDIEVLSLDDVKNAPDVVEDGATFEENAFKKASQIAQATGLMALADDSGLEVEALGGAPGIYSARFAGERASDDTNNKKLLDELKDIIDDDRRAARFKCVMVLYDPSGNWIKSEGVCKGIIAKTCKGKNGFGYDPVFFLPGLGRTMAELTKEEKSNISHRAMALKELIKKLPGFLASHENKVRG